MSRKYIQLGEILSAKWLIQPVYAEAWFPTVLGLLQNHTTDKAQDQTSALQSAIFGSSNIYEISEYGELAPPENAPKNSICVIGIKGPITKYDQFCGSAGMLTKASLMQRAANNPNVKGFILDIDSGGGEASATEMMSQTIAEIIASGKPVVALVTGMAASAAYWIAAACQQIIISGKTSEVGSIGTYVSFADFTAYYEQQGIKLHTIYAPQSTLKNKAFEDALKGDYKAMEADLKVFTEFFINYVKEQRPAAASSGNQDIFKGAMFYSEEALKLGLVDQIGGFALAVDSCESLIHSSNNNSLKNSTDMKIKMTSALLVLASMAGFEQAKEGDELEFTSEHLEKVTTQIAGLNTQIQNAATEKSTLENQVTDLTKALSDEKVISADWKQKYEAMPGATQTTPQATSDPEQPDATKKGIGQYGDDDADYVAAAKEMFGK